MSAASKKRLEQLIDRASLVAEVGGELGRLDDCHAELVKAVAAAQNALDLSSNLSESASSLESVLNDAVRKLNPITVGNLQLLHDAEIVGDVGVRLGKLKDADLPTAITSTRDALSRNPPVFAPLIPLQTALNKAVQDISPISLNDLRSGWRPYEHREGRRVGLILFFIASLLIVAVTAYTTRVYERAKSMYATTLELQEARGAEQAMRLFGMLKRNEKEVADALASGKKEFLYEAFAKALFDLEAMNSKFEDYAPLSANVMNQLDLVQTVRNTFSSSFNSANPANDPRVAQYLENYKKTPQKPLDAEIRQLISEQNATLVTPKNQDAQFLLSSFLGQLQIFNDSIKVNLNPLNPYGYFNQAFVLRDGMSFLGSWLLPALYGMLGAIIFQMRRMLDPSLPNSTWLRVLFRVVLGGFAGIVIVWFWNPTAMKVNPADFATLTSFGVAFLVGFSTDVFFQALDRLVTYMSELIGKNSFGTARA
jgi:hypothetical protein